MSVSAADLLARLKARARPIPFPDGRTRFLVEGDLLLDETGLEAHAKQLAATTAAVEEEAAGPPDERSSIRRLMADQVEGRIVRWDPAVTLSYRVKRASFPDEEHYREVVTALRQATADWARVCGVRFEHRKAEDAEETRSADCLFEVVYAAFLEGNLLALAFFPRTPPADRVLWVSEGFHTFREEYDPAGMMRHELGHVLGFRHEFIHPDTPGGPAAELGAAGAVPVSETFDPKSCMHYPTERLGDKRFLLTDIDAQAARGVYGAPRSSFEFCR